MNPQILLRKVVLLFGTLCSFALWLIVSSILNDAIRTLAKSNFKSQIFGSISVYFLCIVSCWMAVFGYALYSNKIDSRRIMAVRIGYMFLWVTVVSALTISLYDFVAYLRELSVIVWILEVVVAMRILGGAVDELSEKSWFDEIAVRTLVMFTCVAAAKVILLLVSPGIAIK
jgi:hypothetical protein